MSWKFFTNSGQQKTFDSSVASSVSTVASASSIAVTGPGTYLLTGTTTVATITGGAIGMTITVQASGQASGTPVVLTYGAGSNAIKLTGGRSLGIYAQVPADTAAGAGESVTLRYDGTAWVEIARDLRTVLGYTEITSSASITATSEATANAAITGSAITYDGATAFRFEFYCRALAKGTTEIRVILYDGSGSLGQLVYSSTTVTTLAARRYAPAAGAKTHSVRAYVDAGTGTIEGAAGGSGSTMPAYLKISRDV